MSNSYSHVIQAMAAAAGIPAAAFTVELHEGEYILNHPDSQKWSAETRAAVLRAAKAALPAGSSASLM